MISTILALSSSVMYFIGLLFFLSTVLLVILNAVAYAKLLPVLYFMATFTLPYELRSLAWHHQREVFTILFLCVSSTLRDFGLNPKNLGAEIGMTMVLHTHNRNPEFQNRGREGWLTLG